MRKHQKTLNELIEENKKEILGRGGLFAVEIAEEQKPIPANQTPQIELLYRDIQLLNDERNQLINENNQLRRSNAEIGRLTIEKNKHERLYQEEIKLLKKHSEGEKRTIANQADKIHKLKTRLKKANAEIERLGGERV